MIEKIAKVETRVLPLSDIHPADYNPRMDLTEEDQEFKNIKDSIESYGYGQPILVNKRNMVVVSGHQRLKVLKKMGYTHAAVILIDYDEARERGANIAHNKAVGRWDYGKLAQGLRDLEGMNYNVDLTFFDKEERESLYHRYLDGKIEKTVGNYSRTGKEYLKLDWNKFKIWHAAVGSGFRAYPRHNYLISWGALDGAKLDPWQHHPVRDTMAFVDSGLLAGSRKEGRPFIERQGEVLEFARSIEADWCAMMDIPMMDLVLKPCNLSPEDAMDLHLKNAERFSQENMGSMRRVMVIQGQSEDTYRECMESMRPYIHENDVIAIGGIAFRSFDQTERIINVVRMVSEGFPGQDIHLFGVTRTELVARCFEVGATSCDSSTAGINQFTNTISFPEIREGGKVGFKRMVLSDQINFPLSHGRKLREGLYLFNMVMVEAAILLAGGAVINEDKVEMPPEWEEMEREE